MAQVVCSASTKASAVRNVGSPLLHRDSMHYAKTMRSPKTIVVRFRWFDKLTGAMHHRSERYLEESM